ELVGLTTHDRRRQLRRAIGERAYWAAIAHYLRGSKEGAAELKVMARLYRSAKRLPPLGYVWRRPDTLVRAAVSLRSALTQARRSPTLAKV
ncbi:MAG: hypothetical protein JWL93_1207, partial [Hyphomicrobiales bacterium]|nr:hypothetical protein [Hyphomicrobiales bacterium]